MSGDDRDSGSDGNVDDSGVPKPGLPTRIDVRRAFDVYVYGRNRTVGPDQKGAAVSGSPASRPSASNAESQASDGAVASVVRVSVPRELRFDRNAGTWRDRLTRSDGGVS